MKRGQTSVEFLVIFAIVLIVIVFIVSNLGIFPSIGTNFAERNARQYWQTEDIAISSYVVNASGVGLELRNNLDESIRLEKVFINNIPEYTTSLVINPGNFDVITFAYITNTSKYSYDISFEYTNLEDFKVYTLVGSSPIIGKTSS